MCMNNIKISLKMKNKGSLSIQKIILKTEKCLKTMIRTYNYFFITIVYSITIFLSFVKYTKMLLKIADTYFTSF